MRWGVEGWYTQRSHVCLPREEGGLKQSKLFVGLHASSGLTSSNNQIPVTTKERSAQGMVPSYRRAAARGL